MIRKVAKGPRSWSPREGAPVWLVVRWGDWNLSYNVYATEKAAVLAVVEIMQKTMNKIADPSIRNAIRQALDSDDYSKAFDIYTEYMSSYGYNLEVSQVPVQH